MKTTHHIYTAKRKVLWEIGSKLQELGDFKYLDILVLKTSNPTRNVFEWEGQSYKPNSYEELEDLLKDVDKVWSFDRVEADVQGAIGYDIIVEE